MTLELQPITFSEACEFVSRHHDAPQGWKFGIAVNDGEKIVMGSDVVTIDPAITLLCILALVILANGGGLD